ncbi:MAG: DUF2989 domain-containing protein [Aeromonas molluscorum]|jgi:hypothetical protein|uniref:DUF2989 domain-containing protein n=1 Tax=Aeromonas molluscorum TaxID=271417 RepID=UPI003C93E793
MTHLPLRRAAVGLAMGLSLVACNDDRLQNICASHPELCQDLVDDGWCRYERTDVIRARFTLKQEASDRHKFELMSKLEGYLRCIERSTHIEYKYAKERKSDRVEGMLAAGAELERLDGETRQSQDPYLLIWHWTNNTNEQARQQFLAQAGTPALEEPALQLALGGIYAKTDPERAIQVMEHGLSLYREGDEVDSRLLTSLSTLHMGQKHYPDAYLWGKVSAAFLGGSEVSAKRFSLYHSLSKAELASLDAQAAELVQQIKAGAYRP